MRMTQYIGHTIPVQDFIKTCEQVKKVDTVYGMFDEEVCDLYQYKDHEGNIWEEFEQFTPWSSGPMIFLAIKNLNTGEVKGWVENDRGTGEYVDFVAGEFFA